MRKMIFTIASIINFIPTIANAQTKDICALLERNDGWDESVQEAGEKWNVKPSNILAFIDQESRFRANASNGPNFGYAQSTAQTWGWYLKDTKSGNKLRSDFDASVDFVGWHFSKMNAKFGIGLNDVAEQYLIYQMGTGGYQKGASPAARAVANKVTERAKMYERQMDACGF